VIPALRRARVPNVDGLVDVVFDDDRIARLSPTVPGPGVDVDGRVVLPGLVDAHVHLDKAFHLDAIDRPIRSVHDAIACTADVQRRLGPEVLRPNAERLLQQMVRHGTTAARVHVELTPALGIDAVRWHREVAAEWADRITLQLVAFPQHGLFHDGSLLPLLDEALDAGCTVLGACPYSDDDQLAHIAHVFEVAARRKVPLDFHIDFTSDRDVHFVDDVVHLASLPGWRHRVAVGHVTSLASMDDDARGSRAHALAEAGVSLISLPATDTFLERQLAPIEELAAAGVTVAVATNNVQNAFTPFGRGDLLQMAWLAGIVGRVDHRVLLSMVTSAPARILGLTGHGLDEGCRADVVVLDTDRVVDAVAGPARVEATIKSGRVVWASGELRDRVSEGS